MQSVKLIVSSSFFVIMLKKRRAKLAKSIEIDLRFSRKI